VSCTGRPSRLQASERPSDLLGVGTLPIRLSAILAFVDRDRGRPKTFRDVLGGSGTGPLRGHEHPVAQGATQEPDLRAKRGIEGLEFLQLPLQVEAVQQECRRGPTGQVAIPGDEPSPFLPDNLEDLVVPNPVRVERVIPEEAQIAGQPPQHLVHNPTRVRFPHLRFLVSTEGRSPRNKLPERGLPAPLANGGNF